MRTRYPGTIHLVPGWYVAPICTGDDCKVCNWRDKLEEVLARGFGAAH